MTRTDELRALLARVEEAREGDRDLDEAVHALLLPDDTWWRCIVEGRRLAAAGHPDQYVVCPPQGLGTGSRMRADSWATGAHVASYTASVDACLWLIGAALPGAYLDMDGTLGKANWCATIRIGDYDAGEAWTRPTPALALIAALLSALISKEEAHAEHL